MEAALEQVVNFIGVEAATDIVVIGGSLLFLAALSVLFKQFKALLLG